jgi:hypothetical protein
MLRMNTWCPNEAALDNDSDSCRSWEVSVDLRLLFSHHLILPARILLESGLSPQRLPSVFSAISLPHATPSMSLSRKTSISRSVSNLLQHIRDSRAFTLHGSCAGNRLTPSAMRSPPLNEFPTTYLSKYLLSASPTTTISPATSRPS